MSGFSILVQKKLNIPYNRMLNFLISHKNTHQLLFPISLSTKFSLNIFLRLRELKIFIQIKPKQALILCQVL
jgi:hypothetical protein